MARYVNSADWLSPSDEALVRAGLLLPNPEERTAVFARISQLAKCSMVQAVNEYNHLSLEELQALAGSMESRDPSKPGATKAAAEAIDPIRRQRYLLLQDICHFTKRGMGEIQREYGGTTITELEAIRAFEEESRRMADKAEDDARIELNRQQREREQVSKLERLQRETEALRKSLGISEPAPLLQPGERKMRLDD